MDFKKLFRKDDKAVSPVIGVILMVAITVILAAAIGSSVFGHGTSKSAPQASLDIKKDISSTDADPVIRIEHLGGSDLDLSIAATKVIVTTGSTSKDGQIVNTVSGGTNTLNVGEVKTFAIMDLTTPTAAAIPITAGTRANIKFIDVASGQIYIDKDITF